MVTWYEKTVEYAFARKFLDIDAMPLSGTAEKIGDTIFHDDNQFCIVEFKRGKNIKSEMESEKDKYLDWKTSIKNLYESKSSKDSEKLLTASHYVVYGQLNQNSQFELWANHYVYFLGEAEETERAKKLPSKLSYLSKCFTLIDNLDDLKKYLQLLINEKEASSKDSSSVDYGNTLIVDKDGNACALSDKAGLAELNLNFEIPTPKNTPSSPSFGMK